MKRIYRDEKIYIRNMQKEPLVLHSDNGSPMKGATMWKHCMHWELRHRKADLG